MVDKEVLNTQLRKLNLRFRICGRAELKELRKLLRADEKILHCVYGFYQGGSGLLVATTERLLLIDKRPFFVNLEDLKYELISVADLSLSYLQACLHIRTGMKRLSFRSVSDARLRQLREYIVERINNSSHVAEEVVSLGERAKPYLNPAWRARHTTLLPRRRPTKFYPAMNSSRLAIK